MISKLNKVYSEEKTIENASDIEDSKQLHLVPNSITEFHKLGYLQKYCRRCERKKR